MRRDRLEPAEAPVGDVDDGAGLPDDRVLDEDLTDLRDSDREDLDDVEAFIDRGTRDWPPRQDTRKAAKAPRQHVPPPVPASTSSSSWLNVGREGFTAQMAARADEMGKTREGHRVKGEVNL